ncbi:sigma-70 family RNA polymerase sigma factor [Streptomyces sp. NBC_00316]|uniref:sigma-70 family RNA polymerase sigma factor n=1 Tax=Streptomyces sp. NBC_00316 TaxID=2975710 RepID=UPI002E29C512|nr:sigma-70 family RNA polymerase sigma factor [Streptomyces sp. NBC_00316]
MYTYLVESGRASRAAGATATSTMGEQEDATSVFLRARPVLFNIANQILGDASEAEDVIQEAWLRWHGTDRTVVLSPPALLRTATVRLAINVVQSARRRRECSATPWLPELVDTATTPEVAAEQQDSVERAVLRLMETLTPRQRAAYVLREGFGYPYDRIAELLSLSVANARQQVARAQGRLATPRHSQPTDSIAHRRLVQAFSAAARSGDLARLEEVLCTDAGHRPERVPLPRQGARATLSRPSPGSP